MPESLHIQMCKEPYKSSNHHYYDLQILNYLDVHDQLTLHHQIFETFTSSEGSVEGSVAHTTSPLPCIPEEFPKHFVRECPSSASIPTNPDHAQHTFPDPNMRHETAHRKLLERQYLSTAGNCTSCGKL